MSVRERHGVKTLSGSHVTLTEYGSSIALFAHEHDTVSKSAVVTISADEADYLATKLRRMARRMRMVQT